MKSTESFVGACTSEESQRSLISDLCLEHNMNLDNTCWFDYRGMSPVIRTYLYADRYIHQARKHCAMYFDESESASVQPLSDLDVFKSLDAVAMWNARAFADELCLPYDFVLRFIRHRNYERGGEVFPRPNQLYCESISIDLIPAWEEHCASTLVYSEHGDYRAENYTGTENQREHIEFAVKQVRKRPPPHYRLLARLFREGVMSPASIGEWFGDDETEAALNFLREKA